MGCVTCCMRSNEASKEIDTEIKSTKNTSNDNDNIKNIKKDSSPIENIKSKISIETINQDNLIRNNNTTFATKEDEEYYRHKTCPDADKRRSFSVDFADFMKDFKVNQDQSHHRYSQKVFENINNLRTKPQDYLLRLKTIIENIKQDIDTVCYLEQDGSVYKFRETFDHIKRFYDYLSRLYQFISVNEIPLPPKVEWSESLYENLRDYLLSSENEYCNLTYMNKKISSKIKDNDILIISNDGKMEAENKLLITLIESSNVWEDFMKKSYSYGAVCSMLVEDKSKVKTIIALSNHTRIII